MTKIVGLPIPRSPRSVSTDLSSLSGSPPALDPNTLALLDSFLYNKAEEERRFNELAAERAAAKVAGLAAAAAELDLDGDTELKPMISVDEYRLAFGEDWQLSQFWYSTPFANTLAKHLHDLCTPDTQIAFLCCPTTFVAFQHQNPLKGARLLEYDQRFAVLSPGQFVPYDLDEPEDVPESLKGTVEIAVADPPFLNEITNTKVAQTLRLILHPTRGRLLLLTSTSIEDVIRQVYAEPPLGPLKKARMEVQHGRLANDFACWGTWEGVENWGEKEEEYTHRGEGWREGDAEGAERTHLNSSGKKSALDGKETEKP